jgi:hypothetical protein
MTRRGKTHRVPKGVSRRPRWGGSVAENTWAGYRSGTGSLPTCGNNIASRKVIEANGGLLEDKSSGKVRYWVPTS